MFNFRKFILLGSNLNVINSLSFQNPITEIIAPNSCGKTLLCDCIDFLLGSSDQINGNDGLDNVVYLQLEGDCFSLRRSCDGNTFFVKENGKQDFEEVNLEQYKEFILPRISTNIKDLSLINDLSDENFTYRSFIIFNFLDQKEHGLLKNIFTKLMNAKFMFNSKIIFKYIFNKNNIEKIIKNKLEIEECEEKLKNINKNNIEYNLYNNQLKSALSELGLKYKTDFVSLRDDLNKYQINFLTSSKQLDVNKDYFYLLKHLAKIEEEIRTNEYEQKELKIKIENLDQKRKMLLMLEKIIEYDNDLSQYVEILRKQVQTNDLYCKFVSSKNYKLILNNLKAKKALIIKDLEKYNSTKSDLDYDKKLSIFNSASFALDKILTLKLLDGDDLAKKVKELKRANILLDRNYEQDVEKYVSNKTTEYYAFLRKHNVKFVNDDFINSNETFFINFDCRKLLLNGARKEFDSENNREYVVNYDVGSHARQTIMQLCCYFAFHDLFKKYSISFPICKTLVLDCVSQPLDSNNKFIVELLAKKFLESNPEYNIIITSDTEVGCSSDKIIKFGKGLNPTFEKSKNNE